MGAKGLWRVTAKVEEARTIQWVDSKDADATFHVTGVLGRNRKGRLLVVGGEKEKSTGVWALPVKWKPLSK